MSKQLDQTKSDCNLSELDDDRPLSRRDIIELIREAIHEFKQPSEKEQSKAAQLERFRQMQRQEIAKADAAKKHAQSQCKHLRIDNTSCIAWMMNSDGVTRGTCMHCGKMFLPEMGDEYTRAREVSTLSPLQTAASAAVEAALNARSK